MLITPEYKALMTKMHENKKFGRASKKKRQRIEELGFTDILDYGCGKGKLKIEGIKRYDPAIEKFSEEPEPADLVVCTDVLEHIEPELLDDVLTHIKSKIKKMGYFVISLKPAKKTLPDGRNAHILLKPRLWWLAKLEEYFTIKSHKILPKGELEIIID